MTFPHDFEQLMTQHLGKTKYAQLAEALSLPAPTSIRINPQKAEKEELELLKEAEQVPWCREGFYLSERPAFTSDPLLHAGCYYVQEASSMFLHHLLQQYVKEPVVALDLCAAPGGKSTLALSALPHGSLLIANEVVRQRAHILAENIIKWGNPNCIVTNNYAADFQPLGTPFDLIICDVPCSGEGMFRKDPASIGEWSLANVNTCWRRQRDIVRDIWSTLKEGGFFIYSTCTYNPLEDEENTAWIVHELGADILSCHPLPAWGMPDKDIHFYPHKTKGEGFFVSILRKKGEAPGAPQTEPSARHKKKDKNDRKRRKRTVKTPSELPLWITGNQHFTIFEENESFNAFPLDYFAILQDCKEHLRVFHAGIGLATQKGKNLQPNHSLAMSNRLNRGVFPCVEVEREQAIAYLRTEAIQLPDGTPKGYVLITHKGHPLGFAKNIGNRANNLYPTEWKIRSTYLK